MFSSRFEKIAGPFDSPGPKYDKKINRMAMKSYKNDPHLDKLLGKLKDDRFAEGRRLADRVKRSAKYAVPAAALAGLVYTAYKDENEPRKKKRR